MTVDYRKCKHELSPQYRDLHIELVVRGAICLPFTETTLFPFGCGLDWCPNKRM
jgi:hypothetical protein